MMSIFMIFESVRSRVMILLLFQTLYCNICIIIMILTLKKFFISEQESFLSNLSCYKLFSSKSVIELFIYKQIISAVNCYSYYFLCSCRAIFLLDHRI